MESYKRAALTGISWMSALRGFHGVLGIVRIGILARLLTPNQFGVFGIGVLVLGFLEIMTETGINVFLIQEKGKLTKYLNSAWVVSIGRGVIIFVFIFLFSPVISSYFEAPSAYRLLVLTSFIPLIRGFINPSIVKFQKYLEFNKKFYFESILFLFETSVAIAVAYITRSETAIIWGMLSSACLEVVASFAMISPKPKFKFDRQNFMEVINRGKWLTSAGVLDYIFTHLDDLVVARFLGTFTLGLYQNAYKIATLIVLETERIFNSVTLPVYSTISDNKTRLKRAFISTTLAVSFIFIPTGLVIMAFSQQIILIILGSAWLGAVPVLRVLVVYSIIKALTNSTYSLFLSLKMQKVVTTISFVTALGLVITVLPLVARYGMVGAAYSTIIGALVAVPLLLYYLRIVFSGK